MSPGLRADNPRPALTMLWWEKELPGLFCGRLLCLELLKTSGWARLGFCAGSREGPSFSAEGFFPRRTARSILQRR